MKKLVYIANIRLPTEKAHGIQIMKMCEAFAEAGMNVELVVPTRKTPIKNNSFDYYKVKRTFGIKRLFCLDLVRFGKIGFWIESLSFAEMTAWYALFQSKDTIFYTRDELFAWCLKLMGKKVIWEAHMGHTNFFIRTIIKKEVPIVVITRGLKDLYKTFGVKDEKIHIAPDGVDLDQFNISMTSLEAREILSLPIDKKVVLYTGHLYSWKGAHTLAGAAQEMSQDIHVVFIGGTDKDIASFKEQFGSIKNISILGKKPHHEVPMYLKAADILVIPNSAKEDISRLYTSPMKLFEYMAVKRVIVASDLPSLREVLNEKNAVFFEPDNSHSLAKEVESICRDKQKADRLSEQCAKDIVRYTWENRAKNVMEFFK